jgi:hypothetical protein
MEVSNREQGKKYGAKTNASAQQILMQILDSHLHPCKVCNKIKKKK